MQMNEDYWKPLYGYEDEFEVSRAGEGRVKRDRVKAAAGESLPQYDTTSGYRSFRIYECGGVKYYSVHRAVLASFVGIDESKPHVDHRNGDKQDNRLENLRWVTPKENNRYLLERHGGQPWKRGELGSKAKLNAQQARLVRCCSEMGMPWGWMSFVGRLWGVAPSTIQEIAVGRNWKQLKSTDNGK